MMLEYLSGTLQSLMTFAESRPCHGASRILQRGSELPKSQAVSCLRSVWAKCPFRCHVMPLLATGEFFDVFKSLSEASVAQLFAKLTSDVDLSTEPRQALLSDFEK